MSTTTENYGLVMPALTDSPPDVTAMNPNWQIIDSELKKHDDEINAAEGIIKNITDGTKIEPSVNIGMNSVIRKSDGVTSIPKFTMQGKSYVNLLGKDGNCEDTSKWLTSTATISLDTTHKVFGSSGIKITQSSGTSGGIYKGDLISTGVDITKYYFVSAYVRNATATRVFVDKDSAGGGTYIASVNVTDTTQFIRTGMKLQPSNMVSGNHIRVMVGGESGQYAYVDGIMVNEITVDEYNNLTVDQLLAKYPYVDSYACLQNPYIEVRHDNLFDGAVADGYLWVGGSAFSANTLWECSSNRIPVKPNTTYTVKAFVGTSSYNIEGQGENFKFTSTFGILNGLLTFTTTPATKYVIINHNKTSTTEKMSNANIMLIEGITAPTEYKPCRIERCVIEGKFTNEDSFTLENGEVSGLLNWKYRTLYGKDHDWQYSVDFTGYKRLVLNIPSDDNAQSFSNTVVKYDGKILKAVTLQAEVDAGADNTILNTSYINNFQVTVSDTDTGWAESISPNADEVRAFMNGWKALGNDSSRYTVFGNIQYSDFHVNPSAFPSNTATTLTTATSNTNTITVANASIFKIGDPISIFGNGGTMITNISGNTLTVSSDQPAQPSGYTVFKIDVTGSSTQLINYCKNNIAPTYEGYQLYYKLHNPEPITDANVHVHGNIPRLDYGDNYLYLDSGMVLGEVANPYVVTGVAVVINNTALPTSVLQKPTEYINSVYKNEACDTVWTHYTGLTNTYGSDRLGSNIEGYDPNATYTVDYQILKTRHTSPIAITVQYQQDVLSAVEDLVEGLNSRQKADSALDTLIDLSVYEKIDTMLSTAPCAWLHAYNTLYIQLVVPIVNKKCIPITTIKRLKFLAGTGTSATYMTLTDFNLQLIRFDSSCAMLQFATTNATVINNIKTYGVNIGAEIVFDCRGRL